MKENVHLNAKNLTHLGENKVKIFPFLDVPLVLQVKLHKLDVHGSMHHSKIHTEKSNKMQQCIKIYYSIFT